MSSKVVLITGGATGIGRAFVIEAARRGFQPLYSYRNRPADQEMLELTSELGFEALGCQADLRIPADVTRLVDAACTAGQVNIVINCAGHSTGKYLISATESDYWDQMWLHAFLPLMLSENLRADLVASKGAVLNISSDGGVVGSVSGLPYGMSKGATLGATASLARSLAPHVRVNTLAPGAVETAMWKKAPPQRRAYIDSQTPLKRTPDPDEVAVAGLDICSWHITGHTVVLNGGRTIR